MSFNFKLVSRLNPLNRTAPAKVYAQPVPVGKLNLKNLANRAAFAGMSNEADLTATVKTIISQAKQALRE